MSWPGILRQDILTIFPRKLLVVISSFGFKHKEAPVFDLVFDVRFLRNPYFVDGLKERNGLDDKVYDYVRGDERYGRV